jgi:hypothetical protein
MIFVSQYRLDHQRPDRQFVEVNEMPHQNQVHLVDAVRHGGKPLQILPAFIPCLHDGIHQASLQPLRHVDACNGRGGAGVAALSDCGKSPTPVRSGSCVPGVSPDPSQVGHGSTCVPVVVTEIVLPPPQRQQRAMDQSSPSPTVYLCVLFGFWDFRFLLRHGSSGRGSARLLGTALVSKRDARERLRRVGCLPPGFLRTMNSFP